MHNCYLNLYKNFQLLQPTVSDHERHLQFVIREKMRGFSMPTPKGRGSLLLDLAHEMKELKEELEDRHYGKIIYSYLYVRQCVLVIVLSYHGFV